MTTVSVYNLPHNCILRHELSRLVIFTTISFISVQNRSCFQFMFLVLIIYDTNVVSESLKLLLLISNANVMFSFEYVDMCFRGSMQHEAYV